MKSILLASLFTLLIFQFSFAIANDKHLSGQAKIDSLLAELPNAKGDTNEVVLLEELSYNYWSTDPDKGIEFGKKGVDLAEKIDWEKGKAFCYNTIGINYSYGKNDNEKGIDYFQKALKIEKKLDNRYGIARNLGHLASAYTGLSEYPKALEYNLRALEMNEELEKKSSIAVNLTNIGIIYQKQKQYEKALSYYKRALVIDEEINYKHGIASLLSNIGAIFKSREEYDKALEYYHKAEKINKEVGNKNYLSVNLTNIGVVHRILGNYNESIKYHKEAISIAKEVKNKNIQASNYRSIGVLYKDLSESDILSKISKESQVVIYDKEKNLQLANTYFKKSLAIYIELKSNENIANLYYKLHEVYYEMGNYKSAIDFHRKYKIANDSIFNQQNSDRIAALEKAREDDLKQKEIEKQKLKIAEQEKREQLILYFSIGFILVMAVVMFIIYRLLKRSDKLLYNVLPVSIAKRLKNKEHPISDYFTQASIVFIDIVNFTEMAKDEDPRKLVESLNAIFTSYDTIANKYGLEKIKTIGDSYMAAAGIPEVQKDNTHRAAQMALEVKQLMSDYRTADGIKIEVRIGLDCGPVVAGVIGENKFIYDMWSDAVNTASRMESSSESGQVHITDRFKEAVSEYEELEYVERGEIEIKGKGMMKTYYIENKELESV